MDLLGVVVHFVGHVACQDLRSLTTVVQSRRRWNRCRGCRNLERMNLEPF